MTEKTKNNETENTGWGLNDDGLIFTPGHNSFAQWIEETITKVVNYPDNNQKELLYPKEISPIPSNIFTQNHCPLPEEDPIKEWNHVYSLEKSVEKKRKQFNWLVFNGRP